MAATWKTVRVFISSTFRDMQAERDHLVRFVFPKLREELLPRRIHLIDVDLRWGVTSEQDAFEVCREIIDECRPRFLCMLGGRYGWIPPGRDSSITADEVHYAVLDRRDVEEYRFFYFRDPAVTAAMVESEPGEFREPQGGENERKLEGLKRVVKDAGFEPRIYWATWDNDRRRLIGLEEFGERVYADLMWSVDDEFGEEAPEAPDEFTEETAAMEAFIQGPAERYLVGSRKRIFDEITVFTQADGEPNILMITGGAGLGKSALLGKFYLDYAAAHPNEAIIPHFVGASAGSTDLRRTLRRLCHELVNAAGTEEEIPEDIEELLTRLPEVVRQAAAKKRVIIIIDALNQFDPAQNAHSMHWLPYDLPENVRVIVSSLEHPAVDALRRRGDRVKEIALKPLDEDDARSIVEQVLARYSKRMTDEQIEALLAKRESGSPLYLLAALEELRTLGTYEEITDRIRELPGRVQPMFRSILKRLEQDPGFHDEGGQLVGEDLVRRYCSYIAVSRSGMAHSELAELIAPGDAAASPPFPPDLQGNVAALGRLLRPYLMRRGGLIDFYHNQLRRAVEAAYLDNEPGRLSAHRDLAAYFRHKTDPGADGTWGADYPRGLSELPFHETRGQQWAKLAALLTDADYLTARLTNLRVETHKESPASYEEIYVLFSDAAAAASAAPPGTIWQGILDAVRLGLQRKTHILRSMPMLAGQAVHNALVASRKGAIASHPTIDILASKIRGPWLRLGSLIAGTNAVLRTLEVGTFLRRACIDLTGERAAAATDLGLFVWDVRTGRLLKQFAFGGVVLTVGLTSGGKYVAGGASGGEVGVWEVETGNLLWQSRAGSTAYALSISPDDQWLAVGGAHRDSGGYLCVWHCSSGVAHLRMNFPVIVRSLAISPDSRYLLVGDQGGTIYLLEIRTRQGLGTFHHHRGSVKSISFHPDGGRVTSADQGSHTARLAYGIHDGKFLVWWLMPVLKPIQKVKAIFSGLLGFSPKDEAPPHATAFLPSGRAIITGDMAGVLSLRDPRSGAKLSEFTAHVGRLRSLGCARDRPLLVSGARGDPNCLVWDTDVLENETDRGQVNRILPASRHIGVLVAYEKQDVEVYSYEGEKRYAIPGTKGVLNLAFCEATREVAMFNVREQLGLWRVPEPGRRPASPRWHRTGLHSVRHPRLAFSDDGGAVAVSARNSVAICRIRPRFRRRNKTTPVDSILGGLLWENGCFTALQMVFPSLLKWFFERSSTPDFQSRCLDIPDEPLRDVFPGCGGTAVCITYVSHHGEWFIEEEMRRRMGATGRSRISVIDMSDGKVISSLLTAKPMWRSAMSSSGKYLALSCEGDDRVRVLSMPSAHGYNIEEIAVYPVSNKINAIAFDSSDDMVFCGEMTGCVHFLRLITGD